ncbi:MAG: N-acetylmuramoyl-L-alanine amidase [Phycisphaerales bacterium]|nr:N-acetylmuramoyl-L-alanine amidase [Phycisphaerales bacterium]
MTAMAVLLPGRGCTSSPDIATLPQPDFSRHQAAASDNAFEPLARLEPDLTPIVPTTVPPRADAMPLNINIIPRSRWTSSRPKQVSLYPMGVGRAITIHHDAIPLNAADEGASRRRLQSIRRTHVQDNGWSDIGYHFAVDRAGRIWEARPLLYQGAHVKNRNPGNIGIVLLGDFETQSPTLAQVNAMTSLVRALRSKFNIPLSAVATHREWPGASTDCPGRRLQAIIDTARSDGSF